MRSSFASFGACFTPARYLKSQAMTLAVCCMHCDAPVAILKALAGSIVLKANKGREWKLLGAEEVYCRLRLVIHGSGSITRSLGGLRLLAMRREPQYSDKSAISTKWAMPLYL